MRSSVLISLVLLFGSFSPLVRGGDWIDARVVQIRMPNEDVELSYIERTECFTVALLAKSASVEGVDFYVGDGKVAVGLKAHTSEGIIFQGSTKLPTGYVFKKGSTVKVLPGYKQATDLAPGTVYITLPGVTFEVPEK